MLELGSTAASAMAGGLLGAGVKLIAGLFKIWIDNRKDERNERLSLADKQIEFKKLGPDPSSSYVSFTRRILAFGVCFTFCGICLLWAVFPGYPIIADGGDSGTSINLLIFHWKLTKDLGIQLTTGAIVWQLIPFMSMIMMTYFTPDVSKA